MRTENLTEGMAYLTLAFNHVIPLVSYSFTLLFGFNRSENHKPLVVSYHVTDEWPILAIFGHLGRWKPVLYQPCSCKDFGQSIWGLNIVFQDDCHNF